LFIGLLCYNFFCECIGRSTTIIISNSSFVKKVVFPTSVLVWVPVSSALFNFLIGYFVWLVCNLVLNGDIALSYFFAPLLIFPLVLFTIGIAWIIAAVGVYVRDISQVVPVALQLLLYLSPVLYPRDILPKPAQNLMLLNPVTIPIEQIRNLVNFNLAVDYNTIALFLLVSLVIFYAGRFFFDKCKGGFADAI
jgi:lipopolysaccharide transport system permease protein